MFREFVNALIQKGSESDADDNDNFSGDDYFYYACEGTTYDSLDDIVAVTPVEKSIIAYV